MKNPLLIFCVLSIGLFLSCNCKKNRIEYIDVELADTQNQINFPQNDFISIDKAIYDLEIFNYLLRSCYCYYDNGADFNKTLQNAKNVLLTLEASEINTYDFIKFLYSNYENLIKDSHFDLKYKNLFMKFSKHLNLYYSDYLEKNNDINLFEILNEKQKVNENLFLYSTNNENKYRICYLSELSPDYLNVNGKKIPLNKNTFERNIKELELKVINTENSCYIKCNRFIAFNEKEEEKLKAFLKLADCKKENLIIDLRGNAGGYDSLAFDFVFSLFCGEKKSLYERLLINMEQRYLLKNQEWIYSPMTVKAYNESFQKNNFNITDSMKRKFKKIKKQQKSKPFILYESENNFLSCNLLEKRESSYKGKIIFITDRNTASVAEMLIILTQHFFKNVSLIGENTRGCLISGDVFSYILPKSNIIVSVPVKKKDSITKLSNAYKEGQGLMPDYWSLNEDLNNTLFYVTADEKMKEILHDAL